MKAENEPKLADDRIEATTTAVDEFQKADLLNRGAKALKVESVALADAIAKDNPDYRSKSQMKLYAMMALCVLNGIMNGYDGSVMSAINAMDPFQDRFKIGMAGPLNGATFSMPSQPFHSTTLFWNTCLTFHLRYLYRRFHHRLPWLWLHHGPMGPPHWHVHRSVPHHRWVDPPSHQLPSRPVHGREVHRRFRQPDVCHLCSRLPGGDVVPNMARSGRWPV